MKKTLLILAIFTMAGCTSVPSDISGRQAFFDFNSAELTKSAKKELKKQALYMEKHPETKIIIEGRCDERGSTEYNLALGAKRANSAAKEITSRDIDAKRIKTISYGKENPIYTGTGEKVWAKNRNTTTRVAK